MNTKYLLIIMAIAVAVAIIAKPFVVDSDSNEDEMQKICDSKGGEPDLFKTGLSDVCGFDVYRGRCLKNGVADKDVDVLVANGKSVQFSEINNSVIPTGDSFGDYFTLAANACHKLGRFSSS